jgi:hypothetical protein
MRRNRSVRVRSDTEWEYRVGFAKLSALQKGVPQPSWDQLASEGVGQLRQPALVALGQDERVGDALMWNVTHKPVTSTLKIVKYTVVPKHPATAIPESFGTNLWEWFLARMGQGTLAQLVLGQTDGCRRRVGPISVHPVG